MMNYFTDEDEELEGKKETKIMARYFAFLPFFLIYLFPPILFQLMYSFPERHGMTSTHKPSSHQEQKYNHK